MQSQLSQDARAALTEHWLAIGTRKAPGDTGLAVSTGLSVVSIVKGARP